MNNKVKFLRGTSDEYAVAEKDGDTIYFTTNDGKLYIGDKEVSGDGSVTIDDALSDTSTNPVQNKIVKQAIDNKADKSLYGDTTINVGRKVGSDIGEYSTAEGSSTTASGYASHAEGSNAGLTLKGEITFYSPKTVTISDDVIIEVDSSQAYGLNSHAEGCQTLAYGNSSHAEGSGTVASGSFSHAEGSGTVASGSRSHTEGIWTIASGASCHAEGKETTANGNNSCHAEGSKTTANGIASHAEGSSSNKATDLIPDLSWQTTTDEEIINAWNTQQFSLAHGGASHVEGSDNLALGHESHAEGSDTVAVGNHSHTSGFYTQALHDNEAAYGKYNVSNPDTLFSIGDGTADDARHNAFEITTTGGKLHDKDIATTDLIPTSLPANGGNADTLDGLHADEIANNPNILINPDFKINQRGQSSYYGAVYGVDRWTGIYGGELVEVTDYGISATFANNQGIRQFIENSDQYKGKQLTMSVCYNLKKGSYGDRSYCGFALTYGDLTPIVSTVSNEVHDEFVVKSATGIVPHDVSNLSFVITANGVVGIKWVKVEIGSVATPFVAPVPAIERLKIQAMDGKINPYVTGEATVEANSNVCVSKHGFTPCAVVWWDGNYSGVAVSFNDTQFTIDKTSSVDRRVNYLIFK